MPDEMHWGPFTLQWSQISWIVAILTGYGLMYWRLQRNLNKATNNEIVSIIGNGLFAFFIMWKFGAVLSDPSLIWTRPLGLIMYSGGLQETYYGIIAAVLVIFYSLRRRGISLRVFADILPWGILGAVAVYQLCKWRYGSLTNLYWGIYKPGNTLIQYHPLNGYVEIVALGVLLTLLQIHKHTKEPAFLIKWFSISFGIGMLLVTFFAETGNVSFLSAEQIGYALLVLIGIFSNQLLTFIDHSFIVHPNERKERDDMDDTTINSPEQNNKEQENEALKKGSLNAGTRQSFENANHQSVDKKLDGPDQPSV